MVMVTVNGYEKTTLSQLNRVKLISFNTKTRFHLESYRTKKVTLVLLPGVLQKTLFKEFYCSGIFICMCFNMVILFFYSITDITSAIETEAPPSAILRKYTEEPFEHVN